MNAQMYVAQTGRQSAKHRLQKPSDCGPFSRAVCRKCTNLLLSSHMELQASTFYNLSLRWLFAKVSLTGTTQEMM